MARTAIYCLLLGAVVFGKVRPQLELFFDIVNSDSIISLLRTADDTISVVILKSGAASPIRQSAFVPPQALERLLQQAELESVAVGRNETVSAESTSAGMASTSKQESKPEVSNREDNRYKYILTQSIASSYVYGAAIPMIFDMKTEKIWGMQLITFPAALVTHFMLSRDRKHDDARFLGVTYFSSNSIALSYMVPYILLGPTYREKRGDGSLQEELGWSETIGHIAVLGGYPLGLYLGYKHGEKFKDNPGRITLQASSALAMGLIGLSANTFLIDRLDSRHVSFRINNASFLLPAIGGHYLSQYYRQGDKITGGIGPGILTHTALGMLIGATVMVNLDLNSDEERDAISSMMTGSLVAGFAEGAWFFRDEYDTYEQAGYQLLGGIGGMLLPIGFGIFFDLSSSPKSTTTSMCIGALGGYTLTRYLTQGLANAGTGGKEDALPKGLTINLLPVPEPVQHNGVSYIRYRLPLVNWRFN